MDRRTALRQIAEIVGPDGVVPPAEAERYLVDERRLYHGAAALIVRPRTVDECSRILAICNRARLGVVPQGGNTGYCGGATPFDGENQVLLLTTRLDRIREVDPTGFTLTAEAGVVLADAQAAAAEHGLLFPLSMGSEGSCRIGGNVATNAGGLAVLRYGTMRDLVLGLEIVLPNGDVLSELEGLRKDNTGYQLNSIFVGAEGTLGLVTAAVLKLFPRPRSSETAWLAVPSPDAATALLGRARGESGDEVVSAEYVSRASLELVLRHIDGARDPLDRAHEHYLLLELASSDDAAALREKLERIVVQAADAGEIVDGVLAESGPQRDALWRLRETVPEAERREGGAVKHDVSVRISDLPRCLDLAGAELGRAAPHRRSIYGHIGDGNLHYNLLPPAGTDFAAFVERHGAALTRTVHDTAVRLGGSFSAEHGVGVLKVGELARYRSPEAVAVMTALKRALDPNGIMNPGKVIPPAAFASRSA